MTFICKYYTIATTLGVQIQLIPTAQNKLWNQDPTNSNVIFQILSCLAGKEKDTEKKKNWSSSTEDTERRIQLEFFDKERPVFNLDDLLRSSAEVLGKGNLGTTYKVVMETGPAVAVKRLKEMNSLSKKEFVQQMQLLGQMRHENLLQIISFYYSKEEKLVIHEFVPDGSLFELLHG